MRLDICRLLSICVFVMWEPMVFHFVGFVAEKKHIHYCLCTGTIEISRFQPIMLLSLRLFQFSSFDDVRLSLRVWIVVFSAVSYAIPILRWCS